MKRSWFKTILTSGLAATMLVGCGSNGSSGNAVTVNLGSEPPEMASFLCTDSTAGNVLRHVTEGLVTLNPDNEAIPGVAKEIPTKENGGISKDGKTITFNLNEAAKWDDGTPVTAQDFEFAWDQLFSPTNGAGYASTWAPLIVGAEDYLNVAMNLQDEFIKNKKGEMKTEKDKDGNVSTKFELKDDKAKADFDKALNDATAKALKNKGWKASEDGKTFTVKLTGPYTYFVNLMAFYNFAPLKQEAYENGGGLDKYANDVEGFLGNGPFKMTEWKHEDTIVLVKNENYWNKDAIKLDQINMRMIKEANAALNEFENGTIDMIGLTGEQALNLSKNDKNVLNYSDGSVWYLEFNHKVKGLNNAKVRQALNMGYDVDTYIETVKGDKSTAANTFTAPSVYGGKYTESLGNLIKRSKDFSKAKKLLEEGLKEEGLTPATFKISLLGDANDDALKQYAYFQNQWKENLGIDVEIEQVEFKTRIDRMQKHKFDIVFAGWSADYDDPMSYLDLWLTGGGNNHGQYANPKYDKLVKSALKEGDPAKREALLKEAEKLLVDDCVVGTIYHRQRSYICSDRIQGVVRNAFSDLDLRFAEIKK